jgi:uncharacterized membrane protein
LTEVLRTNQHIAVIESAFRARWAIPLLMAAVALIARMYGLGGKPLWYDEVLTLRRAALPFSDLAADSFHNKHYPLFFLLTKPFAIQEWSEAALRLPACLFGALSVLMAARIAGDVAGRWAAVVTGALMALSPLEVQYGQEARPYTLASAAILVAVWGLLRLLDPATPENDDTAPRFRVGWIAYAGGMAVALNTIGAAAPSFIAINAVVAALALLGLLPRGWPMRTWLLVNLGVLILWLPGLLSLLIANTSDATRGLNWVPPFTWELAYAVLASLYMLQLSDLLTFEPLIAPIPLLGFALVALAVLGGARLMHAPSGAVLITLTIVMPAALAAVSLGKPMFVPRYLLWSTGPFFILVGIGLATLPAVWLRAVSACGLVLAAAYALSPYYTAETKPRWDLAAAYLAEHAATGDVTVVSSGLARLMLDAYLARSSPNVRNLLKALPKHEIVRALQSGADVWLVHGRAGQGGNLVDRETFASAWRDLGSAQQPVAIGRHIVIWRRTLGSSAGD